MRKILAKISGTITDLTGILSKYDNAKTASLTLGTDALYVGSWLPFNQLYINAAANTKASTLKLSTWSGGQFRECDYVLDDTNCLALKDNISFVPTSDYGWTAEDSKNITELSSFDIKGMFWLKIEALAVIDALAFSYIGNLFSNDYDLATEYPALNRSAIKTAIQSGKTEYIAQEIRAAEIIEQDLTKKGQVYDIGQVMDCEKLKLPSVSKTAEIIFQTLGADYEDNRLVAHKEYVSRMEGLFPIVDTNSNGVADKSEAVSSSGVIFI